MRLGVVGAGSIVREFLPHLVQIDGIEVVAVQGRQGSADKARKLCAENRVSHTVFDFDALCAAGIDTVYIAVPNFLHFDYCKQALERGKNVIVEKPMTSNLREAEFLRNLAEEKQLFLFEAVTTLYLDSFAKIQEWLPRVGTVKLVQSQYSQYSRRYDAFRAGEVLPAFDPRKAGGALMDLNLYNLHFVMGLFGRPDAVQYYANVEKGIDTSGVLMMQYPSFQALCLAAKDSKGFAGMVIQGTDGWIKTTMSPNVIGSVTLELNDGTVETFSEEMAGTRLVPEFTAFVKAIDAQDRAFCRRMLDKSVAVSEIQTKARLSAGIHFPADEKSASFYP